MQPRLAAVGAVWPRGAHPARPLLLPRLPLAGRALRRRRHAAEGARGEPGLLLQTCVDIGRLGSTCVPAPASLGHHQHTGRPRPFPPLMSHRQALVKTAAGQVMDRGPPLGRAALPRRAAPPRRASSHAVWRFNPRQRAPVLNPPPPPPRPPTHPPTSSALPLLPRAHPADHPLPPLHCVFLHVHGDTGGLAPRAGAQGLCEGRCILWGSFSATPVACSPNAGQAATAGPKACSRLSSCASSVLLGGRHATHPTDRATHSRSRCTRQAAIKVQRVLPPTLMTGQPEGASGKWRGHRALLGTAA